MIYTLKEIFMSEARGVIFRANIADLEVEIKGVSDPFKGLHRPRCVGILLSTSRLPGNREGPDDGSVPAYPPRKSWDAASGKTGLGKEFSLNIIPGSA